jgi:hypothetical protein
MAFKRKHTPQERQRLKDKAKARHELARKIRELPPSTGPKTTKTRAGGTDKGAKPVTFSGDTRAEKIGVVQPIIALPQATAPSAAATARPSFYQLPSDPDSNMRIGRPGSELRKLIECFSAPDNSGLRTSGRS